jgi:outer membrane protein OmpA-like peptidoglycan-associated protein
MKSAFIPVLLLLSLAGGAQQRFTIYFDFNRSELDKQARLRLDSILLAFRQDSLLQTEKGNQETLAIQLDGFCDPTGSSGYNDKLSEKRVSAVKTYFIQNGLSPYHITGEKGYGELNPVNENKTEKERQLNRRVEISLVKTGQPISGRAPAQRSLKEQMADSTLTPGSNLVLQNINFYGGMHRLLPESLSALNELLDIMKNNPKLVIEIHGHICCQAQEEDALDAETQLYNLSEARAKAVRDHLIANGIATNRISYKGFGHSQPIYPYPEKNEEEKTINRRVEIKILRR